jgi:hypothetical protein
MIPIDFEEICERLRELQAYSPTLALRMEHEVELPEVAVPFLIERLEKAYARCDLAGPESMDEAVGELATWLVKSFQFYLARLMSWSREAPWCFRFPKTEARIHH